MIQTADRHTLSSVVVRKKGVVVRLPAALLFFKYKMNSTGSKNDMKSTLLTVSLFFRVLSVHAQAPEIYSGSQADRDSLAKTSILIRAAFSKGNVDGIMAFHHPHVIKALGYKNYQVGEAAVKLGITATLEIYRLEFIENIVESLIVNGNTAIEQTLFTIKGTPKSRGKPFIFKGRTIIVYIRYIKSPTGWATIREQIQQATE